MLSSLWGAFLVLHGLVHLLYSGQSARLFELQPGMAWPDGSWYFKRLLGNEATRVLVSILCILAAIAFVAGGVVVFVSQPWWRSVVVGSAAFSAIIFIVSWDGRVQALANKGLIGILINVAILIASLAFRWPSFGF